VDERQHAAIQRWERRWVTFGAAMLLLFLALIVLVLATEGGHIVHGGGRLTPAEIAQVPLFSNPGATELTGGDFQIGIVAQAFSFNPAAIDLPVGAHARFYLTSKDVLHGFMIENTNVNLEVIPGELAYADYVFRKPGTYHLVCNEYCGINHQDMIGTINVLPAAEYRQKVDAGTAAGQAAALTPVAGGAQAGGAPSGSAQAAAPAVSGGKVYASNCASCHGQEGKGHPGAFPPLAGHAPGLYRADRGYPIDVLLYGLQGKITVDGHDYDNVMPAWSQLSDAELAAVANAMMNDWGNGASLPADFRPYSAGDFASARGRGLSAAAVHDERAKLGLP